MASQKTGTKTSPSENTPISRVGKRRRGYDTKQVDEFLAHSHELYDSPEPKLTQEEIQNVSFSMESNGYSIAQVDAVLTRLESAVVDKRTEWDVQHYGRVAWRARTDTLARSLHDRAARPHGERFSPGTPKKPSYDRKQVDHVIDCLIFQIAGQLGNTEGIAVEGAEEPKKWRSDPDVWSLDDVANVVFTQRTGKHGYEERQVDAYLKRVIQVLARIESFERIVGSVDATDGATDGAASAPAPAPAKPAEGADAGDGGEGEGEKTVVLSPLDETVAIHPPVVPPAPAASAPAASVTPSHPLVASDDPADNVGDDTAIPEETLARESSSAAPAAPSAPSVPAADATLQKMTFAQARHSSERASSSLASLVSPGGAPAQPAAGDSTLNVPPVPDIPQLHISNTATSPVAPVGAVEQTDDTIDDSTLDSTSKGL